MVKQDWDWWKQKARWQIGFEEICEETRRLGRMMSEDELVRSNQIRYQECVYHYGSTEAILGAVAWKVFGKRLCRLPDELKAPPRVEASKAVPHQAINEVAEALVEGVVKEMVKAAIGTSEAEIVQANVECDFGTQESAKRDVGNEAKGDDSMSKGSRYTYSEVFNYAAGLTKELGRIPTQDEIVKRGEMAYSTLIRHLGPKDGWAKLLSVESTAEGETDSPKKEPVDLEQTKDALASLEVVEAAATSEVRTAQEILETTMEMTVAGTADLKVRLDGKVLNLHIKLGG